MQVNGAIYSKADNVGKISGLEHRFTVQGVPCLRCDVGWRYTLLAFQNFL
jgi:hypothetical protein